MHVFPTGARHLLVLPTYLPQLEACLVQLPWFNYMEAAGRQQRQAAPGGSSSSSSWQFSPGIGS